MMNKRLEELLKQSGLQPYYDSQQGDIEIFAEMIIAECAAIAWFAEQYDMGDGKPISKQIKEYFGVEK